LPSSLASVKQIGWPPLNPGIAAATGGGATPGVTTDVALDAAPDAAVTIQLTPFSKPQPSLLVSDTEERQTGVLLAPD